MPVHTFDAAWNKFIQTDRFSLNKTELSLKELNQLHEYVKTCPDPLSIYLSDIRLVSQHTTNKKEEISSLEQALLNLLGYDLWQVIRLNKIEVIENLSLSENFFHRFLCFSYYQELKKLNLSLPYQGLESYLLQFFKKNNQLEILRLDLDYDPPEGFISELSALITDSELKELYFGNTPLDLNAYNALDLLLDNNYRLKLKIPVIDHQNEELHDTYTQLVQRTAKKGYERFKEEQLTQNKLLTIAEYVLRKWGLADFLSRSDEDDLPIMTKIVSFHSRSEFIPQVYKKHPIYINQNYRTLILDLMRPFDLDPQKTVAHHLINVAIEMKDGKSIITILEEMKKQDEIGFATLLNAGNENSALAIFSKFDGKQHRPSPWLKPVLNYIEKNIDYLIPRFANLSQHKDLYALLKEFRDHLTNYLETINARSGWSDFFKCITGIASHLKERKEEWDIAFQTLINAVEAGTNPEQPLLSERIKELRQYLLPLAYNAYHAKKGWRNTSELHDKNFHFVKEVDRMADDLRIQLAIAEDSEKRLMQEKITTLEAALKEKYVEIKNKDEIIESQEAYIKSLESGATPACSKNIAHTRFSSFDSRESELEQGALPKRIRPNYLGIFASVKPPTESSLSSPGSYSSLGSILSFPSLWGGGGSYGD